MRKGVDQNVDALVGQGSPGPRPGAGSPSSPPALGARFGRSSVRSKVGCVVAERDAAVVAEPGAVFLLRGQRYGLTIDQREADALDQVLAGCASTELITFARGAVPTTAAPTGSVPEAIAAAWDDNQNVRTSVAWIATTTAGPANGRRRSFGEFHETSQ